MKRDILAFGLLLLGLSNCAAASLITYEFDGVVDQIDDRLSLLDGLDISVGAPITGSFSYELVQAEKSGGPYAGWPQSKQYSVSSLSFILDGRFYYNAVAVGDYPVLQVWDNNPVTLDDQLILLAEGGSARLDQNSITRFDTSLGLDYSHMAVVLRDPTQTAFSSLDVPESLALDDFYAREFNLGAFTATTSTTYDIRGHLTSLRAVVPEPATSLLLAVGLMGLFRVRSTQRGTG